jgi:hypothetical protein
VHFTAPPRHDNALYITESKDGGVLLDLANDRLLKLNSSGVVIWRLLSQGIESGDIARRLAEEYQVDKTRVSEDIQKLLKSASELGLDPRQSLTTITQDLTKAPDIIGQTQNFPWYGQNEGNERPEPSRLLVVKAWLGLALFDVILTVRSFEVLCRMVGRWPRKPQRHEANSMPVGTVCSAVERACVWYPKRALCLQRSAVTACILRGEGVDAHMVVGVRTIPFLAHAWVEVRGAVINDWPRVRQLYPPLAVC